MKIFAFLILALPISTFAEWKVGTAVLDVVPCPNRDCYISKKCSTPVKKCSAMSAYKNPVKGIMENGGMNPGSGACKSLKGNVNIATDESGNQEGFCVFNDKSVISLGGIWK